MREINGRKIYTRAELKKEYGVDISDVHEDAILSNISVQYKNAGFIAEQVLPVVPVRKENDKFYTYTKKERFTIPESTIRAPRTRAQQIDWSTSTDTYDAIEYALASMIDDREKANADAPISVVTDSVEFLKDLLMLEMEKRVADLVFSTSNITNNTTLTSTNQWDAYDETDSNPLTAVETGRNTVHQAIGQNPNLIVMGREVFNSLIHHPVIENKIKHTTMQVATEQLLANLFQVDKVLVGNAVYNSENIGQTASYGYVWGKKVLIAYVEPRPGIKKVSLGYMLRAKEWQTRTGRDDFAHSDLVEVGYIQDEKLVASDCGYLIDAAVG
jgi:hypothetical protein